MAKTIAGIYKITSPSGKIYIGKILNIKRTITILTGQNRNTSVVRYL